jgi:hypothetical protein
LLARFARCQVSPGKGRAGAHARAGL